MKKDLIVARRKGEHQRRAYILTQGQLEVAQDILCVMEERAGTPADESLLLESQRAQRRLAIKQKRAEEKSMAQMPVVAMVAEDEPQEVVEVVETSLESAGGEP